MPPRKKAIDENSDAELVVPVETGRKAVEAAIKSIKKGTGLEFVRMKDKANELRPVLPTGIFGVDHYLIGSGGIPRGRITEIYGAPSGGKGTLTSQLIGHTQRTVLDKEAALIDAECAFDPAYGAALGVDTENLLVAQPEYGEQALQAAIEIIASGSVSLVVVDSVAALTPKAELDGEMLDGHMGQQARMMGQAMRKMVKVVSDTNTALVFINQVRATMGTGFGPKSDTPGGKALKFYSSVRISVDRIQQYKEKDTVVGSVVKLKGQKNKTDRPFQEVDLNLLYKTPGFAHSVGFDGAMSLVDMAIAHGVWVQNGKTYMLASTGESVSGRTNLRDGLKDDSSLRRITEEATLTAMGKTPAYIKRALNGY
jgi:recombination protein RecA